MSKVIVWNRDHPLVVLFVFALISIFFVRHARDIRRDPSSEGFMVASSPDRVFYDRSLEVFGADNITVVYIRDRDLFSYEKLRTVEEVFYALQDIPNVTRVDGLFDVTNVKGEDGILSTSPLLNWIPEDPSELARIQADALRNPLINRTLISADGAGTALTVTVDSDPDEERFDIRMANDIDRVIAPLEGVVDQVFQVGEPVTRRFIDASIQRDQRIFLPLLLVIVLAVLVFGLRSWNGAGLAVITGGSSVVWTLGFMALLDIPIDALTVIIPSLILILGTTEDIHMLSEYLEGLEQGEDRMGAIAYMAEKTGLAVFLTGLTTFLGFLSITVNEIVVLKQFGMAAAFALFINPIITVSLVPVYLRFLGEKKARPRRRVGTAQEPFLNRVAGGLIYLVERHPKRVLIGFLAAVLLVGAGIFSLQVDNDPIGFFKEDSDLWMWRRQLQRELSGAQSFSIVVDAGQEGAFRKSEALKTVFNIQQIVKQNEHFDSSLSLADYMALVHRELSGGNPDSYAIPDRDDLISQYLLFFSDEAVERYVSPDFSQASIRVRHNITSSYELKASLNELRSDIESTVGETLSFQFTGKPVLYARATDQLAQDQAYSVSLILVFIFIILSILFVRIKAGLLALIPNSIPILFLFGTMGWVGIPLNMGTSLIAVCAIGIAVDDTIHLFTRYYKQ